LKGEDAAAKVAAIVGDDVSTGGRGETIRDTFGDSDASTGYFEPGVIAPGSATEAAAGLALLAAASDAEGGILDASASFPAGTALEKTLVLIKPDNFAFANTRPGGVIDLLTRTGLALVGFKPFHMSVAQGEQFYGPVLDFLVEKLPDGRAQWESIIAFMSGKRPSDCSAEEKELPGSQPCIALIYQGPDAVAKIRSALGPTNPANAPHGTIRKEFGTTIMINGAHASDSVENVARETGIIRLEENDFKTKIAALS
jgi:nucleoside diphosphate kinase